MLKLGDKRISVLRLGGTEIKKAYLGEAVVFNMTEPPVLACTISASIDPAGSGMITGAGTYPAGATVTITAEPGDGYKFTGWQENGTVVSEDAAYTFVVTGDRTLVAAFAVASRLPEGYTELEYVRSLTSNLVASSSKYAPSIPLVTLRDDSIVKFSVYPETFPAAKISTTSRSIPDKNIVIGFMYQTTSSTQRLVLWINQGGLTISLLRYVAANVVTHTLIPNTSVSKWYDVEIDFGKQTYRINGAAYNFVAPSTGLIAWKNCNTNGLGKNWGSSELTCDFRIGQCAVLSPSNPGFSYTDTFIPAKKVSGSVIGFYRKDKASFVYKGNQNTSTSFTAPVWAAGPAV